MANLKWDPKTISEHAKTHKKGLCSYEIIVPEAKASKFKKDVIFGKETDSMDLFFTKHTYTADIKGIYEKLKTNYERECGDLIRYDDPQYLYFLICSEMAPGFKKTQNHRYLGLVEVFDDVVQFMWIHPFLRNRGLMSTFFQYYARYENMLTVQPPISDQCKGMMKKVTAEIGANKDLFHIQMKFTRKYFKKYIQDIALDSFTDDDIMFARRTLETFCAMMPEASERKEWSNMVDGAFKCAKYFKENPEQKEQLREWAKKNVNIEEMNQLLENFRKYGKSVPDA